MVCDSLRLFAGGSHGEWLVLCDKIVETLIRKLPSITLMFLLGEIEILSSE